jgi:hypothetical protein
VSCKVDNSCCYTVTSHRAHLAVLSSMYLKQNCVCVCLFVCLHTDCCALDNGIQAVTEVFQVKELMSRSSVILCINCCCYRNLSADVTRFLPTALRVKREDKKKKEAKNSNISGELIHIYIYVCVCVCVYICVFMWGGGEVVKVKLFPCPSTKPYRRAIGEVKHQLRFLVLVT